MERNLSLSKHAAQRLQQRGIRLEAIELLNEFGRRLYTHDGAAKIIFDHAARRRISAAFGKAAAQLKFSVYAVVDASGDRVITVGHRRGRCHEHA